MTDLTVEKTVRSLRRSADAFTAHRSPAGNRYPFGTARESPG